MSDLRVVYAGDRDISVWVLRYLRQNSVDPAALLVPDVGRASHAEQLAELCPYLPKSHILVGKEFGATCGRELLVDLQPDLIICVHFPYIVSESVFEIPKIGVLNLHPAYLPFNRGWHTPSWALLEETPIGATLHFMDAGIDSGDIVHQRQLIPSPADTADTLYKKLKQLELEVFKEAWPQLVEGSYARTPQDPHAGSTRKRQELFQPTVQQIDLDIPEKPRNLLRRLRALSTNSLVEAAYFEADGRRYRVQVTITEESPAQEN